MAQGAFGWAMEAALSAGNAFPSSSFESGWNSGVKPGWKATTNKNTWNTVGKYSKKYANTAYNWAKNNIPLFHCFTSLSSADGFLTCIGLDDEIECAKGLGEHGFNIGASLAQKVTTDALVGLANGLFDSIENSYTKSSGSVKISPMLDPIESMTSALQSINLLPNSFDARDVMPSDRVPILDVEAIVNPLLDAVVNESKDLFNKIEDDLLNMLDNIDEKCHDDLCFNLVIEKNYGTLGTGALRYWSPLISVAFCLAATDPPKLVVSTQLARYKKEEIPKTTVTLKASNKIANIGSTSFVSDSVKYVDVTSSQGAWLGLGLKMFTNANWLQNAVLGLSGEFKIGLSGIKMDGTMAVTNLIYTFFDSSGGEIVSPMSKPISASFHKFSIVVLCPWCPDFVSPNSENTTIPDFSDLRDNFSISNVMAEQDSIPAPSGFTL